MLETPEKSDSFIFSDSRLIINVWVLSFKRHAKHTRNYRHHIYASISLQCTIFSIELAFHRQALLISETIYLPTEENNIHILLG